MRLQQNSTLSFYSCILERVVDMLGVESKLGDCLRWINRGELMQI